MNDEICIGAADDSLFDDAESETSEDKTKTRNSVAYVGFCFFILFSGHAVFRSLLPAWKPQSGPLLVAASFFAYALGSLIPPRISKNNRRLCFTFGALAQAQWIGTLQLAVDNPAFPAVSTISSFINGLGAGLLWSTEGAWMSSFCAERNPHQAEYYTGMFLAFYGASGFLGNVAAMLTLLFAADSISIIVWCLFAVACCGGLMLLFAPRRFFYPATTGMEEQRQGHRLFQFAGGATSKRFHQTARADTNRFQTIRALFRETFFAKTIPAIMALAFVSAFSWVTIPNLCSAAFDSSGGLPAFLVPTLFALYACANAFGAPLSSLLIKKTSTQTVFALASIFIALPVMLYFMIYEAKGESAIYGLAVSSFLCGAVVGTYNNCLYALYASKITVETAANTSLPPENYQHLIGEAYCWHGFLYCICFTIFSSLVAVVAARWLALIAGISTILGSVYFQIIRV